MPKIFLRRDGRHRVEAGHPWVYQSEIAYSEGEITPGDMVDVYNYRHHFLGRGYINPRSQITVRLLTRQNEEINRDFFRRRLVAALAWRQRFLAEPEYCRLVFGEADFLPALIVDRFGPYLVLQTLALGMAQRQDEIVSVLEELLAPAGIYERNDVPVREREGLAQRKGYIKGHFPTTVKIVENGIPLYVDLANGQKTGYFYDQRDNRRFLRLLVPGARVLDCFCHTGSFAVNAALYGARHVECSDISEAAVSLAQENARLNGVSDKCTFQVANAFDRLRALADAGEVYDVIILDPPAFTKSRDAVAGAARGYKEINLRALKMLRSGGFLVTCSCSYHMSPEMFLAVVLDAARDAHRTVRQVAYRTQALDHPVLPVAPETSYLKFLVLQVL